MITEPNSQRCPSCGQQGCRADVCESPFKSGMIVIGNQWHERFKREVDRYRDSLTNDRIAELNAAKLIDVYDPEDLGKCVEVMREFMLDEFKHGVARGMLNGK